MAKIHYLQGDATAPQTDGPPIQYEAVAGCLKTVAREANSGQAMVHMPRIGCGLAGGTWEKMGPLVEDGLVAAGVEVFVYDFG